MRVNPFPRTSTTEWPEKQIQAPNKSSLVGIDLRESKGFFENDRSSGMIERNAH